MSRKTALILTSLAIVASVGLTGCKATEPFHDAPVSNRWNQPVEVYENADGFSNVAEFCDKHGNRIVVAFHSDGAYAALTAIPNDPSCKH
jgi:hypothetical protein